MYKRTVYIGTATTLPFARNMRDVTILLARGCTHVIKCAHEQLAHEYAAIAEMYNNNTKILDITRNAQAIHSDAFQKIGAVQEARHNRYCLFVPVSSPFTSGQT